MSLVSRIFFGLMILMIVACGSNDDPGDALVLTIDRSDIIASNPDWSVVSFINDGKDKSVDFNNYSFEIFSNGDFLINLNGLNDSFGRWSISSDELILTINISNPKPTTSGIVGDWNVTAKSGSALTLESADGTNKTCRLSK